MPSEWPGVYFDGHSAARIPATIRPMQTGLEISLKDGPTLWWPYGEIRQTQGSYAGEQVRLERGQPLPEAVIVDDQSFLTALGRHAPGWGGRFRHPKRWWLRERLIISSVVTAMVGSAAIYFWGVPALVAVVAPHVPIAWEEQLGREVLTQLAPESRQCTDPEHTDVLEKITARLLATRTAQPYTFRIIVVDDADVNAFAAPGGSIVVFRGLIEKTKTADELAGVLAHEMQHVLLRHTTQQLLRQASTGLLITAVTGNTTGAAAFGLKSAELLATLHYSREHEAEADLEGLKMLIAARIDPQGMITFFETLKRENAAIPDAMKYLVTHPQTDDRIQTLAAYTREHRSMVTPLLPNYDWHRMHEICRRPAPTPS